jgi:hypothetical protein
MGYSIINLPTYPQNGKHQRIILGIHPFPFGITKGEDRWYYRYKDGTEVETKPDLWYVFVQEQSGFGPFQIKGFRKPELAVKYALKSYKTWLKAQVKKVTEYKIEESL